MLDAQQCIVLSPTVKKIVPYEAMSSEHLARCFLGEKVFIY